MERVRPARTSAERSAGRLIARNGNVEHRQMRHFHWMVCSHSKRDGRAPIVTDDGEARMLEMLCISSQTSFATVFLS